MSLTSTMVEGRLGQGDHIHSPLRRRLLIHRHPCLNRVDLYSKHVFPNHHIAHLHQCQDSGNLKSRNWSRFIYHLIKWDELLRLFLWGNL